MIIIGYGAKDKEINNIIFDNFDYSNKKTIIIDPYAGKNVKEFGSKLNANIVLKQLEDILISDID